MSDEQILAHQIKCVRMLHRVHAITDARERREARARAIARAIVKIEDCALAVFACCVTLLGATAVGIVIGRFS